jgi:hypothetical protein
MDENNASETPPPDKPEDKVSSSFMIEIQRGDVFLGSLNDFEDKWFLFAPDTKDEEKISFIEGWAYEQGWSVKIHPLH